METLLQDLRYGIRLLFKNPGFTAIAVIALALGIGANSAIFSMINALLQKPFPFKNLDQLVVVEERFPNQSAKAVTVSPADFMDWKDENRALEQMAGYKVRDIVQGLILGVKTLAQVFIDEASPLRFAAVLMLVFG
jgi:putative ABC transport system permease protein